MDIAPEVTAWAAYGMRRSLEDNIVATMRLTGANNGDATTYRFDNARKDNVNTGEVGLRGTLRTGLLKHDWVTSYSYFSSSSKNAYAMGAYSFPPGGLLGTNLYAPTAASLPAYAFSVGDLGNPGVTERIGLRSFSVGDTLSMLDDRLQVTLGARHQQMQAQTFAYATETPNPKYDKSRISPMGAVVFKLGKNLSTYANYSEGFSKGRVLTGPPPVTLPPYVSRQKEVGVKMEEGRLGLAAALFTTSKPRAVANFLAPVGDDRHRGLELNAYGEAMRGLRVLGGVTLFDTEQEDTGNTATEGKRVVGVPRNQANLGVEWSVPAARGLAVDARVIHTGATYADDANTLRVPSWNRIDAGVRYTSDLQGKLVTWRARVENLTNRDHWASVGGYPGNGYLVASTPRTFSVSATFDF